jgi:tRNA-specific 2-thiouridylase
VRATAERLGLAVADKPDSQDICFVPSGGYADVVAKLRPDAAAPGEIVSRDGRVLGQHQGIAHYTVGQARRLGTAAVDGGQRQIVVAMDAPKRRIVVGPRQSGTDRVRLRAVNWLAEPPSADMRCTVKLRAREDPQMAMVRRLEDGADVRLDAPGLPAPGQACVFYDGERVLGGGFICRLPADTLARASRADHVPAAVPPTGRRSTPSAG